MQKKFLCSLEVVFAPFETALIRLMGLNEMTDQLFREKT